MSLWLAYGLIFVVFNFGLGIIERLWLRPALNPGDVNKTYDYK